MSEANPKPPNGYNIATNEPAPRGRSSGWVFAILLGVLVLGGGGFAATWWGWPELYGRGEADTDLGATAEVRRGTMEITVVEDGDVRAAKQKVIRNELRWPAYIEEVAPQGPISAGETIIRFKCDELEEEIIQQEQQRTSAENAVARATADLEITTKEQEYKLTKAAQAIEDAREDFGRYVGQGAEDLLKRDDIGSLDLSEHIGEGGEATRVLAKAESDIQMAERDLVLAEDKLDFKLRANEELAPSSPYSENEIRADRLSVDRLKLNVQDARMHLYMLRKYDIPRELRRLWAAVEATELAYDRAEVEHQQAIARARQDKQAQEMAFRITDKRYQDLLRDRDEHLHFTAEEDGIVVYESGGRRWEPEVEIEVGAKVNPRQQLMIIPDMRTLQIETKVYESMISAMRSGLKARVRLDAKPNEVFAAHVEHVAPMAEQGSRWMNPGVKTYEVVVKLDEQVKGLDPNMTARVEMILGRVDDALIVPVDAVFQEGEVTKCFVVRGGQAAETEIEVGRSNRTEVEIVAGLKAGEQVLRFRPEEDAHSKGADEKNGTAPPGRGGAASE